MPGLSANVASGEPDSELAPSPFRRSPEPGSHAAYRGVVPTTYFCQAKLSRPQSRAAGPISFCAGKKNRPTCAASPRAGQSLDSRSALTLQSPADPPDPRVGSGSSRQATRCRTKRIESGIRGDYRRSSWTPEDLWIHEELGKPRSLIDAINSDSRTAANTSSNSSRTAFETW